MVVSLFYMKHIQYTFAKDVTIEISSKDECSDNKHLMFPPITTVFELQLCFALDFSPMNCFNLFTG